MTISKKETSDVAGLIRVCGHYVFSHPKFKEIKPQISERIKNKIKDRVQEIIR